MIKFPSQTQLPKELWMSLLLILSFSLSSAFASPTIGIGSNHLIKGESTLIQINFTDEVPDQAPTIASNANLLFRSGSSGKRIEIINGKRTESIQYRFELTANTPGSHVIPPIEYRINGKKHSIDGIPLHVFSHSDLQWSELDQFTEPVAYATALLLPKNKLYVGESVTATVKLILPSALRVADPGLPSLEQKNLSAWRFEAQDQAVGSITLSSRQHRVYTYTSIISPLAEGETILGPGSIRPVVQVSTGRRGFSRYQNLGLDIELPTKSLTTLSLPSPIPSDFSGGIGNFQIKAEAENPRAEPGSPLTVILSVLGIGNLDNLSAPILSDQQDWKLYDAAKHTRDEERRSTMGQVRFTQILRPEKNKESIPAFTFTFFNPDKGEYETLETGAIPILASAVPSAAIPIKEYTGDILGLIPPKPDQPLRSPLVQAIARWWQLIPAFLCLLLLFVMFQRKIFPKMRPKEAEKDLTAAISHLRQLDGSLFLREVGHFIETRLPPDRQDNFTTKLLNQRDKNCYTKDKSPPLINQEEKEHIITTLRAKALA